MEDDTRTEYTSNTFNTSYTLMNVESDLRCTCLDTCIAGCLYASTEVIHYMLCCFCMFYYNEDDD